MPGSRCDARRPRLRQFPRAVQNRSPGFQEIIGNLLLDLARNLEQLLLGFRDSDLDSSNFGLVASKTALQVGLEIDLVAPFLLRGEIVATKVLNAAEFRPGHRQAASGWL